MKFTTSICSLALLATLSPAALAGQSTDKDFQWYCESDEATPAQKQTVAAIYKAIHMDQSNVSCFDALLTANDVSSLWFHNAGLTDLSPISGIQNLESINIVNDELTSISTLPASDSLESIYLKETKISEFPDFSRFPWLTHVDLSSNPISAIPSLDGIRNIKSLVVSNTNISDLSHIGELRITELDISIMAHPTVLDTVPEMLKLTSIRLGSMELTNVNFVHRFPNLKKLNLMNNKLTHLRGIEKLKGITYLNLNGNQIESIPEGISFGHMHSLNLLGNPIKDFSFLAKVPSIKSTLMLGETSFSDWKLIERFLPTLASLFLDNTPITEISIPEGQTVEWPKLDTLYLSGTKIRSLAFFKQVTAPELKYFKGPTIETKTEENCPTKGVPEVVAAFCKTGI